MARRRVDSGAKPALGAAQCRQGRARMAGGDCPWEMRPRAHDRTRVPPTPPDHTSVGAQSDRQGFARLRRRMPPRASNPGAPAAADQPELAPPPRSPVRRRASSTRLCSRGCSSTSASQAAASRSPTWSVASSRACSRLRPAWSRSSRAGTLGRVACGGPQLASPPSSSSSSFEESFKEGVGAPASRAAPREAAQGCCQGAGLAACTRAGDRALRAVSRAARLLHGEPARSKRPSLASARPGASSRSRRGSRLEIALCTPQKSPARLGACGRPWPGNNHTR